MKSLDQRLSSIVSPFDDEDMTQEDLIKDQYLKYRRDALIDAISKKTGNQEFDLYLDDVLSELDSAETILFLSDCVVKLASVYPIEVLVDQIQTENIIEEAPDKIIDLIKFFVYDQWQDSLLRHLPKIEMNDLKERRLLSKKIKDTYLATQEQIIKDSDIQSLIRYHFEYCPFIDGVKTLLIFIYKDIPGVVSKQLVYNRGE